MISYNILFSNLLSPFFSAQYCIFKIHLCLYIQVSFIHLVFIIRVHCMNIQPFNCLFPVERHKDCLQFFSIPNKQCYNEHPGYPGTCEQAFLYSRIVKSLGMHILNVIILSQSDCTNLHSHQQGMRVLFSHVFTNSLC